jgi:membrane fusion protein (multidrug efflux system)
MKRNLLIIIAVAVYLVSCTQDTDEAKRKQLQKYKQEVHDLNEKIDALETELEGTVTEEVINVKVSELQPQSFEHFFEVTGKVEAEYDIDVSPETGGIIKEIFVKEGQTVQKGFVMAKLNTEVLERSVEEIQVQLDLATTNYNRLKTLWDQNIGSEMQYLQAKNNKESLEKRLESLNSQIDMTEVKSPIDGVVDIVYQEKGDIAGPQVSFAKVVNIGEIKIYADVSESYLTKIKVGDKVRVFFPAIDREVETDVRQIGNTIDPNNRTFRLRLDIKNPDKLIKPNLVSIVRIRDYKADDAIVVPSLLIKQDFKGDYTFIAATEEGKQIAKRIYVSPGVSDNNMTEVISGLQAGMKIISEGFNQVANGTIIQYQ